MTKIQQGEIWLVNFDPSTGQEIQKTRPALVISNTYYNIASGTIFIVPLSSQKPKIEDSPFYFSVPADTITKLEQESFANISQLRSASKLRFMKKIGNFDLAMIQDFSKVFLEILNINILDIKYN